MARSGGVAAGVAALLCFGQLAACAGDDEDSAAAGRETARSLLMTYFVGLAAGDSSVVRSTLCDDDRDVDGLLARYSDSVEDSGPLRLLVVSVASDAASGAVPFAVTTDRGPVNAVAMIAAEGDVYLCLESVEPADGATPLPLNPD